MNYPKYLGIIDCNKVDPETIKYWERLEQQNEVELTPVITEYAFMVFAPKDTNMEIIQGASEKPSDTQGDAPTIDCKLEVRVIGGINNLKVHLVNPKNVAEVGKVIAAIQALSATDSPSENAQPKQGDR
jgi:hypothetical protein